MKRKKFFAHKTAIIDRGAEIGEGTKIWCFSHVMKGAKIGGNCKIGQNVVFHPTAVVGNGVKIQNNVSVYDAVTLEDEVVLLGSQGEECISAEQMASWAQTINYEVVARVDPLAQRTLINQE